MEPLSWAGGGRWMLENVMQMWSGAAPGGNKLPRRPCSNLHMHTFTRNEVQPNKARRCVRILCLWPADMQSSVARKGTRGLQLFTRNVFVICWDVSEDGIASVCEVKGGWPRVCLSNGQKRVCFVLCLTRPPEILHVQPPLPLFPLAYRHFIPNFPWFFEWESRPSIHLKRFNFLCYQPLRAICLLLKRDLLSFYIQSMPKSCFP